MIQNPNYNHPHTIAGVLSVSTWNDGTTHGNYSTVSEVFALARDLPNNGSVHADMRVILTASPLRFAFDVILPVVDCPEVTQ